MIDDGDGSRNADRPEQEAEGTTSARESIIARQKLIEAMIDNNMRQLKFDSAHGGAEIERAWAVREISLRGDDPALVVLRSNSILDPVNQIFLQFAVAGDSGNGVDAGDLREDRHTGGVVAGIDSNNSPEAVLPGAPNPQERILV